MKMPSERQLLLAGAWVLAALFAYLVISGLPSTPPDLAQFYLAGRVILDGHVADLYDPAVYAPFAEQLRASGTRVSPWPVYNRPAFAAIPWAVIARLPYSVIEQLSLAANLIGIAFLTWKLPSWFPRLINYRPWLICYPPFLWGFLMGQDTVFITIALAYSVILMRAEREARAGLLLSLCIVKPHLVWLVPVALFFTGKRRTTYWFIAGATALAATSLLMVGTTGFIQWRELLGATSTDYAPEGMATLRAIGLHTHVGVAILLALGVIAALFRTCQSGDMERALPVAMVASLLLSPHAYAQDASTFAVVAGFAAVPLLRGWLLIPWPAVAGLAGINAFSVTYAIVGLGAILAFTFPRSRPSESPTARPQDERQ